MVTVQLNSLIDLVKFDQRFHVLNSQIRTHEHEMRQTEKELSALKVSVADVKRCVVDARKLVDAHELRMKELQDTEKQKKAHLDQVTNQKEYAAIKNEISQIQQEQQSHEKTLLDAWNKFENLEKEQHERLREIETKSAQLESKHEEITQKIEHLKQEYATHARERVNIEQQVPQEWLEKYVLMREKVTDPVVAVVQGSCTACFYAVPSQDVGILRRGKLIQCKDCYRLLYLEPSE